MRPGTLMLVIAANAIIAVGIVAVAITAFPSDTDPLDEPTTAPRDAFDSSGPETAFAELERKFTVLETTAEEQGKELTKARSEITELREKLASNATASSDLGANATPEDVAAEKASREARRAMFRGMAQGARSMGRRILEGIANPTPESIQQSENRVRRDAQRLSTRLGLSQTRASQVEQALLDVDRRTRDKMKSTIDAKGIDNVTYDDAKPLIEESFKEREQAMTTVLDEKEMETFKQQEAQGRTFIEMGMRMAFPAKPAEGGDGK